MNEVVWASNDAAVTLKLSPGGRDMRTGMLVFIYCCVCSAESGAYDLVGTL